MKHRILAPMATLIAAAALAPAAHAATIAYEGNTLVYADNGGEVNDVIVTEAPTAGYIRFFEYAALTTAYPADRCQPIDGAGGIDCQLPSAMRVELAGGDDEYSLSSDVPDNIAVTITGGDGDDVLDDDYSANAGRSFDGGPGNDTIKAYKGNDVVIGGPGNDKVFGGAGADEVRGGDGNDELEGDKFEAASADIIDGGPGIDVMDEYSIPDQDINPPASVTQDGVANDGRPGENDNVTGMEKITAHVAGIYEGTEGADEIWVWANITGGDSTIKGFGGNDKLTGQHHSESIDGGAGDDTIQGGYGNDTIVGGPGKDKINSDGGSYCGGYECNVPFGDDTVDARDGEVDQVECGIGNDTVQADTVDQVAPSCENVTRGGDAPKPGADGPGGPTGPKGSTPIDPTSVGFALVGKKSLRSGLSFKVNCAAACQVRGEVTYKGKKVGAGAKTLIAPGAATVKVKLTAKGKKALKRARKAKLTLKVTITDPTGKVSGLTKAVTVKR